MYKAKTLVIDSGHRFSLVVFHRSFWSQSYMVHHPLGDTLSWSISKHADRPTPPSTQLGFSSIELLLPFLGLVYAPLRYNPAYSIPIFQAIKIDRLLAGYLKRQVHMHAQFCSRNEKRSTSNSSCGISRSVDRQDYLVWVAA